MQTCHTYYRSPLGFLKVSGTDSYISEVSFADAEQAITAGPSNDLVQQCVEQLIQYFSGNLRKFNIPVHQPGTAFQSRVWSELINIGLGKTISYLELAKRLGDPNCIRAAASANGKNKIAIIVPCHRVVGSNQTLVGYAGGLWRKKWLLQHENKIAHGVQTLFDWDDSFSA